jgi:hypothetical protein
MAQAASISLSKFTATVRAAVKAAAQKHPKFKIDPPQGVTVSYLIRGIPVRDAILANVTLAETQAFANDVAAHIGGAHPEVFGTASASARQGAILSVGRHVVIGIPAPAHMVTIEK